MVQTRRAAAATKAVSPSKRRHADDVNENDVASPVANKRPVRAVRKQITDQPQNIRTPIRKPHSGSLAKPAPLSERKANSKPPRTRSRTKEVDALGLATPVRRVSPRTTRVTQAFSRVSVRRSSRRTARGSSPTETLSKGDASVISESSDDDEDSDSTADSSSPSKRALRSLRGEMTTPRRASSKATKSIERTNVDDTSQPRNIFEVEDDTDGIQSGSSSDSSPSKREPTKGLPEQEVEAVLEQEVKDPLSAAAAVFRRSSTGDDPKGHIGRDDQRLALESFLDRTARAKRGGSIYISGRPGTGKTAATQRATSALVSQPTGKGNPRFKTVYLKCTGENMSGNGIYRCIFNGMSALNRQVTSATAEQVEEKICGGTTVYILVLDEVDYLLRSANPNVSVDVQNSPILRIFGWPFLPDSRLVLIGIANALDLTERSLPVLNCLGQKPELLRFPSFDYDELLRILQHKLESDPAAAAVFAPRTLELCARKVANDSGDLRIAFDLCAKAVELAIVKNRSAMLRARQAENGAASPSRALSKLTPAGQSRHSAGGASNNAVTVPLMLQAASKLLAPRNALAQRLDPLELTHKALLYACCVAGETAAFDSSSAHALYTAASVTCSLLDSLAANEVLTILKSLADRGLVELTARGKGKLTGTGYLVRVLIDKSLVIEEFKSLPAGIVSAFS